MNLWSGLAAAAAELEDGEDANTNHEYAADGRTDADASFGTC